MISFFENRLDEFRKMCTDLDVWFTDDVIENRFREKNKNYIDSFRQKIKAGRDRIADIEKEWAELELKRLAEEDKAESSRIALAKQEEETKSKERLVCAENLKFEI